MSSPNQLLPHKLKWLVISAFAGLLVVMVSSYIMSPKINLDSYSQQSTPNSATQATSSATIAAPNSTKSDADSAEPDTEQAPSVQSVQDVEPTPPIPTTSPQATSHSAQSQPTPTKSDSSQASKSSPKCQFSGTKVKEIFGINVSNVKAYFTPLHKELYDMYLKEYKTNTKVISWYCTEKEAQVAGFKSSIQIQPLLNSLIKR